MSDPKRVYTAIDAKPSVQYAKRDAATDDAYPILVDANGYALSAVKLIDNNGLAFGVKQIGNKIRVSSMPYLYDIAEGNIPAHSVWTKIGFTPSISTTLLWDIWSYGGVINFPASAMQMSVVSSDNTNDIAGGTGALKVTLYYLDNAYAEKTEEITLTGTTFVDTVATNILRINGARVTTAGSSGVAAGNLRVVDKATRAIVYTYLTAGFTRARNSAYTVPAGKTLYVVSWTAGFGYASNQTQYGRLVTRATQNEGIKTSLFHPFTEVVEANGSTFVEFVIPTKLVATVDLKVSVLASVATGVIATSALRGWIE